MVTPVNAGYLSRNWIIITQQGRYFLKEYRFGDSSRVVAAHAALFHFHRAGISVIVPLSTLDNQTICHWEGRFYTLFPFVEGRQLQRGALSARAVESIATLLARLHLAGYNAQIPEIRQRLPTDGRPTFHSQSEMILVIIDRQPDHTPFDELAVQTIRRQQALVATTPMEYGALGLAADHLLHGDYHEGNLFFNGQEEVAYLYDWEKTEIAPREIELVRALLFTCFSNPTDFCGTFAPANFALGEQFLCAYHAIYPLQPAALTAAVHARYWGSLCSLWVPTEHYLQQNERVDLFLEANLAEINYFAAQMEHFTDWLMQVIESR